MKRFLAVILFLGVGVAAAGQEPATDLEPKDAAKVPAKDKPSQSVKDGEDHGDTYNFYFQKGNGPGSVEQGAGAQKVGRQSSAPDAPKGDEPIQPKFELQAGLVMTPQHAGTGIAIGAQFNASPSFGLQVHLIQLRMSSGGDTSSTFSAEGSDDRSTRSSLLGGSFALAYTPVSLGSSVPVRLSGLLGAMVLAGTIEETHHVFSASGSKDDTQTSHTSKAVAFVGLSASAYFNRHWGAVGYGKLTSDPEYSQVGIGAAYLF